MADIPEIKMAVVVKNFNDEREKFKNYGEVGEKYSLNITDCDIVFIHLGGAGKWGKFREGLKEVAKEKETEGKNNLIPISEGCNREDIGCRLAKAMYHLLEKNKEDGLKNILLEKVEEKRLIEALKEIWWENVDEEVKKEVINFVEAKIGFEPEKMGELIVKSNCEENNKSENKNIKIIANSCISFEKIRAFINESNDMKDKNNLVIIQVPLYINENIYFYNGEGWESYESNLKSTEPVDITDLWEKEDVQFIYIVKEEDKFKLSLDKGDNTYTMGKKKMDVLIGGHGNNDGIINILGLYSKGWLPLYKNHQNYQKELENKRDYLIERLQLLKNSIDKLNIIFRITSNDEIDVDIINKIKKIINRDDINEVDNVREEINRVIDKLKN